MPRLSKASRGKASSLATLVAEVFMIISKIQLMSQCIIGFYKYLLRVTMRKLQLRGEEVLLVNLGLDEFCNNATQRNEITLLMTFMFTLEGAQQLQARARRSK